MTALTKTIQDLYQEEITQGEADMAANNLVEFFKILQSVDEKQSQHKTNVTEAKK